MTKEEAKKEIEKVFEPAFANYIITALTEGVTVSDKALEQESGIRNCSGCKYSKDNHNAGTEECHLCMWENQYTPTAKNDLEVDCVSRQQAIDAFPELIPNMGYSKRAITEILQELPSVTPQEPRWIPVSERLPETNDDVLVTDGVDMFVAWYARNSMWQGWMSSDNNFERNTPIDAWMPLPKPYGLESEGEK